MRVAILLSVAAAAYGQAPQLRFDVASVKPIESDAFSTRPERTPGRIRWTTQLNYLVGYAYDLDSSRVAGSSLGKIYAVEATCAPTATDDDVRAMLRTLLTERLHLRTHRVTKQVSGYALALGNGRGQLKPSPEATAATASPGYVAATSLDGGISQIEAKRGSMEQLARALHRVLGVPIWDRTALAGRYDFTFQYAATGGDAPALSTALHELGLTLKKQNGPLDTLMIDHTEDPSEN